MNKAQRSSVNMITVIAMALLLVSPYPVLSEGNNDTSDSQKQACLKWCSENPDCVRCTRSSTCPTLLKKLKTYRGATENWIACGKDKYNARKQLESHCREWCRDNEQCNKCVSAPSCRNGIKTLKRFKQERLIYSACAYPLTVRPIKREDNGIMLRPGNRKIQIDN